MVNFAVAWSAHRIDWHYLGWWTGSYCSTNTQCRRDIVIAKGQFLLRAYNEAKIVFFFFRLGSHFGLYLFLFFDPFNYNDIYTMDQAADLTIATTHFSVYSPIFIRYLTPSQTNKYTKSFSNVTPSKIFICFLFFLVFLFSSPQLMKICGFSSGPQCLFNTFEGAFFILRCIVPLQSKRNQHKMTQSHSNDESRLQIEFN